MISDEGGVSQGELTFSNPVVRYWGRLEARYGRRSSDRGGYILHPDPTWWLGFSGSSPSDGLTGEQEYEIAENIFEWWISGKSYKKWYAEKFLQLEFEFKE